MTNEEYDKMFQVSKKSLEETQQTPKVIQMTEEVVLKKLNLRTLKGAFMVLLMGFALSLVAFIFETLHWDYQALKRAARNCYSQMIEGFKCVFRVIWKKVFRKIIDLVLFKYNWN